MSEVNELKLIKILLLYPYNDISLLACVKMNLVSNFTIAEQELAHFFDFEKDELKNGISLEEIIAHLNKMQKTVNENMFDLINYVNDDLDMVKMRNKRKTIMSFNFPQYEISQNIINNYEKVINKGDLSIELSSLLKRVANILKWMNHFEVLMGKENELFYRKKTKNGVMGIFKKQEQLLDRDKNAFFWKMICYFINNENQKYTNINKKELEKIIYYLDNDLLEDRVDFLKNNMGIIVEKKVLNDVGDFKNELKKIIQYNSLKEKMPEKKDEKIKINKI